MFNDHDFLAMVSTRQLDMRRCSEFIRHVFLFVLLLKILHINASSRAGSDADQDDERQSNLRRVVGNMIGVDVHHGLERRGGGRRSAVDAEPKFTAASRSRSAPRFIHRLYERYLRGDVVHGADTVRSINPELGI